MPSTITAKVVPVIDMHESSGVPEKFVRACEEWGCFRINNHGVPTSLMSEMKAVSRFLVDLPVEMKLKNANPAEPSKGYIRPNSPASPAFEGLSIYDTASSTAVEEFCAVMEASSYQREIIEKYTSTLYQLAQTVVRTIMEGLGLSGEEFTEGLLCQLKLNKYSYSAETVGTIGGAMHTDCTLFTILQDDEDINGVEMVDKITGELVPVDPVPGTLVIVVGDIGKAWSNGRFYNVPHQVQCYGPTVRTSLAFFILCQKDEKVQVSPGLVDEEHPCCYDPFDFQHYRTVRHNPGRFNGDVIELFRRKQVHH